MTKSNKILLKTLLQIELELFKTQALLNQNNSFISFEIDFSHIYDLFEIIISSFNIPETNYNSLYNLLDKFSNNELSIEQTLQTIETLIT